MLTGEWCNVTADWRDCLTGEIDIDAYDFRRDTRINDSYVTYEVVYDGEYAC